MRLIKKIKRFFFGIHEIIWVVVHEIENWLYPYCDRPVDDIYSGEWKTAKKLYNSRILPKEL